ncbi:hypothetical protein ONE63_003785 [Megalurothrips usitatus]|uniref:Copper transport protein n=1 Tax=Megalurothrips usitatus TaxID=439358 RepID=A0AAV7X808_9NEOP|nr:hypothetical protein ONE63_003785 [Megalurothrips usitatus]
MHMTFWFSPDLGTFLFEGFNVKTTRAFTATCVGLAAMTVFLEILKFWRMKAKQKAQLRQSRTAPGGSETSALLTNSRLRGKVERILHVTSEVVMYFTQEAINWIVMLAVMGYNGYIFLSVVAGAGLGYALFGESTAHAKIQNVKMKAAMISCGECQVKDEADEENAPGQSDPPAESQPDSMVPSTSTHCHL